MAREATTRLLEMIENGELDRDTVINACLNVMSEYEVKDMCESEGFFSSDEEESNEEEFEITDNDEVNEAFAECWESRCNDVPAYRTDKPAKRMAFTCFVDELQRDGKISEDLAQSATLDNDD